MLSWLAAMAHLLVARATTRGFQQSVLSKQLNPPVKRSYRKLILWWALVFLSIGWIGCYIMQSIFNGAGIGVPQRACKGRG